MRFVCDSCRAQYMISDEKVGAKGVKVRCKKCGYVILVRRAEATPPPELDSEATQVMQLPFGAQGGGSALSGSDDPEVTAPGVAAPSSEPKKDSGLFSGVEEDEIGAVFDSVLNSGNHKVPAGEEPGSQGDSDPGMGLGDSPDDRMSTRVLDGETMRKLAAESTDGSALLGLEPAPAKNVSEWFVAIDEKQEGPFNVDRVKELWEQGEIGPDSLCWRAGMADWIPVSEVRELASALAPRPAKPVIVAPEASSAPIVATMPVESAFSAGGVSRTVRSDVPVLASSPSTDAPGGWKPSAASALASLVQEEIQVLSKPAPKVEEAASALPGLLDLPSPDRAAQPPAGAMAAPSVAQLPIGAPMAAAAPAVSPYAPAPYAQPAAYAPYSPPPQQKSRVGLFVGLGVGAVVFLALAIFGAAMVMKSEPTPAPVAPLAAVNNPPPPTAPAVAPPVKVAEPEKTEPAKVEPAVAAATEPAKTEPVKSEPEKVEEPAEPKKVAVARVERPPTKRTTTTSRRDDEEDDGAIVASAPKKTTQEPKGGDDEFDAIFGGGSSAKKTTTTASSKGNNSVYIPPAPGSADVQESLGQSDILQTVLSRKAQLVKCSGDYKKEIGGGSGKITMKWNILTSGKTTGVTCASPELKSSSLATCLAGEIKRMQFPKHRKQGDAVVFPFTY